MYLSRREDQLIIAANRDTKVDGRSQLTGKVRVVSVYGSKQEDTIELDKLLYNDTIIASKQSKNEYSRLP